MNFIARIKEIVIANNECIDDLMISLAEEHGELAAAISVERGRKKKEIEEVSSREAIDVIICGFALYFATGGKIGNIENIFQQKLDKWENNV